jgi:hypothetical protein
VGTDSFSDGEAAWARQDEKEMVWEDKQGSGSGWATCPHGDMHVVRLGWGNVGGMGWGRAGLAVWACGTGPPALAERAGAGGKPLAPGPREGELWGTGVGWGAGPHEGEAWCGNGPGKVGRERCGVGLGSRGSGVGPPALVG